MLASRKDVFTNYSQENFERDFAIRYRILEKQAVADSKRTLYLMRRRN
jgi:hypothetical protein